MAKARSRRQSKTEILAKGDTSQLPPLLLIAIKDLNPVAGVRCTYRFALMK